MVTIEDIIKKAREYLPSLNTEKVLRAYEFAARAHDGQKRFSGEPFIIHPLSVAYLLLEYHPDEDSIITALLHDVAEDTKFTLDDIEKAFGADIRALCSALVKLSKVRSRINDPQVENLRKLFLAMANDVRVVMLKLCDRLHNMMTLEHVRSEKRERIGQETLNIYVPIAARLGIYRLKTQLEDLCFMYLHPAEYKSIQEQLEKTGKWREKYIDLARKIILETLGKEGIQAEVDGRVKSVYSIYRKLQRKNKHSIDEIFDVFAMRIILPDIYKYGKEYTGHLYTALGVLHNTFTPLAHRFKDYVAVPKVNGYRSLHTTVIGLGPKTYTQPTEVQIRTLSMHQSGEFGIAAHWIYEELGATDKKHAPLKNEAAASSSPLLEQHKEWISGLKKIEQELKNNQELIENLKVDVFQDRIFVLTPRGDVKDLPAGATPIDFAYAVHTEIGNHCVGAKVNGAIVPIDYTLKSGEVVDIIARKNARPSQAWLSFVKTTHARNRVRAWFRNLDEQKHLREGKELLNDKLQQVGKPSLDTNLTTLKNYEGKNLTMREREDLLREIGRGGILASVVLKKLFSLSELLATRTVDLRTAVVGSAAKSGQSAPAKTLLIGGEANMPHTFVKCCNQDAAGSGEELVGYVTRGRGVSVHKKNCPVVKKSGEDRLIAVKPAAEQAGPYSVHISVEADDRLGLVRDISNIIAGDGINILDFFQNTPRGKLVNIHFMLQISDFDQLEKVLSDLASIPNVRRACKVN